MFRVCPHPFFSSGAAAGFGLAILALPALGEDWKPDEAGMRDLLLPFFKEHCIRCHGPEKDQGEFRVDRDLPNDFLSAAAAGKWAEVVNVLNSHEMPPEDEPQPGASQVAQVVEWIVRQAVEAEKTRRLDQVVLRRLNRNEYRNTIRDLMGVDYPAAEFPADPTAGGFDNIGSALAMSPMQMELYVNAAEVILNRALVTGARPEKIQWRFDPIAGAGDSNRIKLPNGDRPIVNGGKNTADGDYVVMHHDSWDRKIGARDFAVAVEGPYVIRLQAAGRVPTRQQVVDAARPFLEKRRQEHNAKNPARQRGPETVEEELEHFRTDRMYDYGPARVKVVLTLGGQPQVIGEWDITGTPEKPQVLEIPVRMTTLRAGIHFEYAYSLPRELENFWMQSNDDFARPELLIDWFELEGPVHEVWPPKSHQALLPDSPLLGTDEAAYLRERLAEFMPKAWRRPVGEAEIAEKVALFQEVRAEAGDFQAAYRIVLTSVLSSPHFLFLAEPKEGGEELLAPHELASRLSYFVWSSLPDAGLRALADSGRIREPGVLRSELGRLLGDPRSTALEENFAAQWLGLREVGANPPATDLYPRYDRHLELSMVGEGKAFFREILHRDVDLAAFLKSDFVVINERLARFYGIPGVRGDGFRKVAAPVDSHRGGLVTLGAVHAITSNGTRTSPVKRGTWVMKTVLGQDPGLPVANAGDIAPKVPGIDKATVRQRLEIHREQPQCARCHARIDPLGLALENFNAAGEWRTQEGFGYKGRIGSNDPIIDGSARLPDGTVFNGPDELRDVLLAKERLFFRCLAEKLFVYALGREATLADQPLLEGAADHATRHRTLRSLMEYVVTSPAFLRK